MNPTEGDWWWRYGLDGLVGGLIGGAVTGLAVWLTLRHERSLADRTDLLELASRILSKVHILGILVARPDVPSPDVWQEAAELFAATEELSARSRRRWPGLSSKIEAATTDLLEAMGLEDDDGDRHAKVQVGLNRIAHTTAGWIEIV